MPSKSSRRAGRASGRAGGCDALRAPPSPARRAAAGTPARAPARSCRSKPSQALDHTEADGVDERVRLDRPLEEALVRLVPVLHRLEALALVAGKLNVDVLCRDHARLGDLDDRARSSGLVLDHEAVTRAGCRIILEDAVETRGCRLVTREHRLDQPATQVGSRIAEPEFRQLAQRTSASTRSLARDAGSRS